MLTQHQDFDHKPRSQAVLADERKITSWPARGEAVETRCSHRGSIPEIGSWLNPGMERRDVLVVGNGMVGQRFVDRLIKADEIADQAEIARLGQVSRARVTQIMNLLLLAPDIQEEILFLPRTFAGRDPIREIMVRPIAGVLDWRKQRRLWKQLLADRQVEIATRN